MKLNNNL